MKQQETSHKRQVDNRGISLLFVVIVLGVVALIMALGAGLLGIGELDIGYTSDQSNEVLLSADGCMDEALRRLRKDSTYSGGSLSVGDASCIIGVKTTGTYVTTTVTSTIGSYSKKIQTAITLSNNVIKVNSWEELSN